MSEKTIFVYVDREEAPIFVGRLFARNRKGRESASFEYDRTWLENPLRFPLEPALSLYPAPFHTPHEKSLFGSIGDSAPDRWGRMLMRRSERILAKKEERSPQTLSEIDFLLRVDDESRQGALRFSETLGGPFLATSENSHRIPLLIDLPRLLAASQKVIQEDENEEDIKLLFAPGSSLGGARPKASVRDKNGDLLIAKFSHPLDEFNVPAWEFMTLSLAKKAGLNVTHHRLEKVLDRTVLLLERFDRKGNRRIPFLSAMSFLGALDNEAHSYIEIADALRRFSGNPVEDQHELWRRIVFSVLVSNTDDHLRNHAFLLPNLRGWRLSPAYDINPTPVEVKARYLTTAISNDDTKASLETALSVAEKFSLTTKDAKVTAHHIGKAVSKWHQEAKTMGIKSVEIEKMASAFEHEDRKAALEIHQA